VSGRGRGIRVIRAVVRTCELSTLWDWCRNNAGSGHAQGDKDCGFERLHSVCVE